MMGRIRAQERLERAQARCGRRVHGHDWVEHQSKLGGGHVFKCSDCGLEGGSMTWAACHHRVWLTENRHLAPREGKSMKRPATAACGATDFDRKKSRLICAGGGFCKQCTAWAEKYYGGANGHPS